MAIVKNVTLVLSGLIVGVLLTLSLSPDVDLSAEHIGEYRSLSAPLVLKSSDRPDLILPAGAAVRLDKLYLEEASISLRFVGDIRDFEAVTEPGVVLPDGRYWFQMGD